MSMHCPHCRQENATTTRFCTSCGAVLVESMPGGGRRRVLRPWGLRSSAPLTESPAMPEIIAAHRAMQPDGMKPRRLDLVMAGGIGLVAMLGLVVYPYAKADEAPVATVPGSKTSALQDVVSVSTLSAVRESPIVAPPLTLPYVPPRAASSESSTVVSPRPVQRAPVPVDVAAPAFEPPEPSVPESRPKAEPPEPARTAPAPLVDPLQTLGNAFGACSRLTVFERAVCEQRVRLDHCDGHWGTVALCPAARTDQGQ